MEHRSVLISAAYHDIRPHRFEVTSVLTLL